VHVILIQLLRFMEKTLHELCDSLDQKRSELHFEKFINAQNDLGQTALYCSAKEGHDRLVKIFLLDYPEVDVNKPIKMGSTPLYVASYYWSHTNIISLLLQHGNAL